MQLLIYTSLGVLLVKQKFSYVSKPTRQRPFGSTRNWGRVLGGLSSEGEIQQRIETACSSFKYSQKDKSSPSKNISVEFIKWYDCNIFLKFIGSKNIFKYS